MVEPIKPPHSAEEAAAPVEPAAPPKHPDQAKHAAGSAAPGAGSPLPADPDALPDPNASPSVWERLNPTHWFRRETPELWVKDGDRLLESGNRNQALMAYHKAIALDPNCGEAHRGLGRVTMLKGGRNNFEAALVHFREAARLNPFDDRVYRASAIAYEKLGKPAQAVVERKKLGALKTLQVDPDNAMANNNMGVLFMQQEQVERAIECFKKAIAAHGKYDAAYRNLAATYYLMATNAKDETQKSALLQNAAATVAQAVAINASVPSLLTHARILIAMGEANRALDALARAETAEPHNPAVHLVKRTALEKLGRMADAQVAHEAYEAYEKARRGA